MKSTKQEKSFAIYKGDKFLFVGTKKECATFLNVKEKTIQFYTTKTYRNRGKGEYGNRLIVIRVEEGD